MAEAELDAHTERLIANAKKRAKEEERRKKKKKTKKKKEPKNSKGSGGDDVDDDATGTNDVRDGGPVIIGHPPPTCSRIWGGSARASSTAVVRDWLGSDAGSDAGPIASKDAKSITSYCSIS